ncbi:MAG: PaaI family thioesterase [Pseudomonadota bacterium]
MKYEPVRSIGEIQEEILKSSFHKLLSPMPLYFDGGAGSLSIEYRFSDEIERQPDTGHWHGGALGALVDVTGFYSIRMLSKSSVTTTHYSVDFMRIANADTLIATAFVRKLGRSLAFVDVNIAGADRSDVAKGSASYAILN